MAEKKIKAVLEIGGSIGSSLKSSFATITGNTKKLGKSLKDLRDESKRLKTEMKSGLGGPEAGRALDKLNAKIKTTENRIKSLNKIKGLGIGGKFGSALGATGMAFGSTIAGATAAGYAISHLAEATAKYADDAGEAAQKLGMNANALIQLKYAADDVGTGAETLEKSMAKMQQTLEKGRGKPPQVFRLLHLDVAKLSRQKPEKQLDAIAEAFANYKGKVSKTAIAMAIFGKSSKEMVPLLELGKKGLKDYADEADQLGLTLSESALKGGDEFMHQHLRIKAVMTGLRNTIGAELMPVVEEFSRALLKFAKENRGQIKEWAQTVGKELIAMIPDLLKNSLELVKSLASMGRTVQSILEPLGGFKTLIGVIVAAPYLKAAWMIGTLVVAIVQMGIAMAGMTVAGAPLLAVIGLIGVTIGALAFAVWHLWKNWDTYVQAFRDATAWMGAKWTELKTGAIDFGNAIYDGVAGAFDRLKLKVTEWFDWVKAKFSEIGSTVSNALSFGSAPAPAATGGSVAGAAIAGARASGGAVSSGRSYLVGERGPEVFSPATGGNIRANGAGGAVDNRSYVINVHAAPGMDERSLADLVMSRLAGRQAALASGALYD